MSSSAMFYDQVVQDYRFATPYRFLGCLCDLMGQQLSKLCEGGGGGYLIASNVFIVILYSLLFDVSI